MSATRDGASRTPCRWWGWGPQPCLLTEVRSTVAAQCAVHGLDADGTDAVVLAVDELATNARRFGPYELRLYDDPPAFAVADCSSGGADDVRAAVVGGAGPAADGAEMAESGRGLLLVGVLFPGCQVRSTVLALGIPGKEIRFALPSAGT